MDYERDTKTAYDDAKALEYDAYLTGFSWMHFVMWRESRIVHRVLARRNLCQRDWILDVPCGTGILATTFADSPAQVVGCDISLSMLKHAQDRYEKVNASRLIVGDATALPFCRGFFRGAVVLGFAHRLPREIREQCLQQLYSVVTEFVVISYSLDSLFQRLKGKLLSRVRPGAPCPITREAMRAEIERNGFEIERQIRVAPPLSPDCIFVLRKKGVTDVTKDAPGGEAVNAVELTQSSVRSVSGPPEFLACPNCRGPLVFHRQARRFVCDTDRVAYPVVRDIPCILPEQAVPFPEAPQGEDGRRKAGMNSQAA